jgi:TolB-like protein
LEESRDQFNLGTMLLITLAAVLGTTMTVWVFHFMQVGGAAPIRKQLPLVAVLPFHSPSASPADIQSDQKLTNQVIEGLAEIARVEALPSEMDADPAVIGRETGVKMLLIGKLERRGSHLHLTVQLVSTRGGKRVWSGSFEGDSSQLARLSNQIDNALAPHLTALLD